MFAGGDSSRKNDQNIAGIVEITTDGASPQREITSEAIISKRFCP